MFQTLQKSNMPSSKTEDVSYRILFDRDQEEEDIEGTASPATRVGSIESFGKSFHIHQQQHTPPYIETRRSGTENLLTWIRWLLILSLQLLIMIFLIRPVPEKSDNCVLSGKEGFIETGDDINGLYKTCTCCPDVIHLLLVVQKANSRYRSISYIYVPQARGGQIRSKYDIQR